jgi:putative nucleotidyltransferase with HDIG domain
VPLSPHALALAEAAGHPVAEHSRAVAELSGEVADELGLDAASRQEVEIAALLHDIGKLALMEQIVDKPDGLDAGEVELIKTHPVHGQALLERAGKPFADVAPIVRSCHERWDGTGYPDGLAGEDIPLAARIIFCCDAYDAMTSDRPYSTAVSPTRALAELWASAGTQFDPHVASALVRALGRAREPQRAEEAREGRLPTPATERADERLGSTAELG